MFALVVTGKDNTAQEDYHSYSITVIDGLPDARTRRSYGWCYELLGTLLVLTLKVHSLLYLSLACKSTYLPRVPLLDMREIAACNGGACKIR